MTNIVGIVSDNYFDIIHPKNSRPLGITAKSKRGVKNLYNLSLVEQSFATVVRHEIGHQFGLQHPGDDGDETVTVPKAVMDNGVLRLDLVNYVDFMSRSNDCVLAPNGQRLCRPASEEWISYLEWQDLFSFLRANSLDPEVIMVPILLEPSGVVDILPTSIQSLSDITQDDDNGEYSVRLNDLNGTTLSEVRFSPASEVIGSDGIESPLSYPFFLATVPLPVGTAMLQVTHGGIVIKEFNPSAQLLRDSILAIPDQGFDKNPSQRRSALLNKARAFTQSLDSGSTKGALNKLENDIRKSITNWVLESYAVSSSLQMTQAQVLATVDRLIEQLRSSQ